MAKFDFSMNPNYKRSPQMDFLGLRCRPLFLSRCKFVIMVLISVYSTLHSKKYGVVVGGKIHSLV